MKRAVLVLVALALAIAVGLFLVPDGEERAALDADERTSDERTEIGAVELATDDEVSEERVDVSRADDRPIARADADALHWSDLLLAVDHPTGVELDASEVEVRLVTGEGELIVRALDDAVRASDLADGVLGALDGEHHCPRFFRVEDLGATLEVSEDGARTVAPTATGPRRVGLFPSGRAAFEFTDEIDPILAESVEVTLFVGGDVLEIDPRLVFDRLEEWGHVDHLLDLQGTALRVLDPDDTDVDRRAMTDVIVRNAWVGPMLDLEGPPLVAGLLKREFGWFDTDSVGTGSDDRTRWLDELPLGFGVNAMVVADLPIDLSTDGASTWSANFVGQFMIDAVYEPIVLLRTNPLASIIGELPPGARDGEYELYRLDPDPDLARVSWTAHGAIGEGPDFWIDDVRAGAYELVVWWTEPGLVRASARRRVDVEPGEVADIGLLVPQGAELVIAPRVEVDGEPDPSHANGALDALDWGVVLFAVADIEAQRDPTGASSIRATGVDPITVRGLEPGSYHLSFNVAASVEGLDPSLVVTGMRADDPVVIEGSTRIEPVLEVRSSGAARIVATCAASHPELALDVRGYAVGPNDRFEALVPTPRRIAAGSPPWTSTLETTLANGGWTATFAAAPRVDEDTTGRSFTDEERCGWVGTATFEVVTGAPTEVAIELGRAAAVRGSVRAFNGEDSDWGTFVSLKPTDDPGRGGAELWSTWADALDAEVAFHTLRPNTEYRVEGSGRTFTTGGPGSVTVLEEE